MNLNEKIKNLMLKNYHLTGGKYISPASFHSEAQFRWDSCFHAIICSTVDLKDLAKNEILKLLASQKPNGFIPNSIFEKKKSFLINLFNWERRLFSDKHTSDYPQPPLEAQALEWINDPEFTKQVFDKVLRGYLYFIEKQDPDNDGLISIYLPHETGRDADPTFDCLKSKILWWLPKKMYNYYLVDTFFGYLLCWKYKKVNWQMDKIWQLKICDIEDIMYNCIWVDGMRTLERLTPNEEIRQKIRNLADRTEKAILKLMWHDEDKCFYALDNKHNHIKCETISNLAVLLLKNIPKEMVEEVVKRLLNTKKFWLPYPIPSVSADQPTFNPDYPKDPSFLKVVLKIWTVPGLWRGTSWINTNWLIIKGLILQSKRFKEERYLNIAKEIARRNVEMVEKSGFYEFYNPYTGQGGRAKDYSWSGLVATFPIMFKI